MGIFIDRKRKIVHFKRKKSFEKIPLGGSNPGPLDCEATLMPIRPKELA